MERGQKTDQKTNHPNRAKRLCVYCEAHEAQPRSRYCCDDHKRAARRAYAARWQSQYRKRQTETQALDKLTFKKPPVILLRPEEDDLFASPSRPGCKCTHALHRRRCAGCKRTYCDKCRALVHSSCPALLSSSSPSAIELRAVA